MRITLSHATAASGRLSGFVARPDKTGTSLCAFRPRTQPRSQAQSAARHLTGSIASLWRRIAHHERAAWEAAAQIQHRRDRLGASRTPTGYSLFFECNRRLATLNFGYQLTSPGLALPVPGIETLQVIPTYTQPTGPQYLASLPLWIDPTIPSPYVALVRATPALSAAKGHIRRSDFRILGFFVPYPTFTVDTLPLWLAVFGTLPTIGTITYEVQLIDPRSGFAGPPRRTSARFASLAVPDYGDGAVTLAFGGTDVAVVDDTQISFGGIPVAGGE